VIRRAIGPLVIALSAGCAETTVDPTATTRASDESPVTTVFAPTGSTTDLLDQLAEATGGLSALIIENDGQHDALVRIEALWALVEPEVAADQPDLLPGFDAVMALVRRSVERRRPADADKAYNNLTTLIEAYRLTENRN
jgi:hypothetical protein